METKTWTVVQFIDDKSVEAVPSAWVQGDLCHWPSFSQEKLINAIRKSDPLNTCWPSHKVKIFRHATFDDYAKARAKARLAEETSDLASDTLSNENFNGSKSKRKRIQKILSSSGSSNTDTSLLETPPKLASKTIKYRHNKNEYKKNVTLTTSKPPLDISSSLPHSLQKLTDENVASNNLAVDNSFEFAEKNDSINSKNMEKYSTSSSQSFDKISTKVFSENNKSNVCQICKGSAADLAIIKQQNHILRSMISDTLDEVKKLREDMERGRNIDLHKKPQSIFTKYGDISFPIANEEDLLKFEEILTNEEEFDIASTELSKYGGSNIYHFVKRVLSALISDMTAIQYSFLGRKGKKPFKFMKLTRLVVESAEKSQLATTINDTESAIATWLRRSSDRKASVHKKFSSRE